MTKISTKIANNLIAGNLFLMARNASKCCSSLRFINQHGNLESGLTNQLHRQSRRYAYPLSQLGKIKIKYTDSKIIHSSSFSTSSSLNMGLVRWYLRMLEARPLTTKCISSSLIFAFADVTSQVITLLPSDSFDSIRTLRITAYGLLIMGPSQHLWFNFVSRIIPRLDVFSTLKKILLGQAVYGPCMTSVFFSYNAVLRGESADDVVARLKRDLLPTLMKCLMYWPMCDFLTFRFVPVQLQPLVNSSFAYLWTIYLTYMASLQKVAAD